MGSEEMKFESKTLEIFLPAPCLFILTVAETKMPSPLLKTSDGRASEIMTTSKA
jgi:hypothetical protein